MTPIVRRHLFGPGPTNPYPEATEGLSRPLLGHLDPAFLAIMDDTCDRLREVWGTGNARTLPLSATGSAGMEAAFVNIVRPGDVVVVAVNGLFGQRMCEVAGRCGARVVPVEHPWGTPVDPERVLAAHPAPAIVAAVHAGLGRILAEGLEQVWARHAEAGQALQDGLEGLDLELFAEKGSRLPDLTTVKVPDGVDSAAVRRTLLERYDIEIGAGVGEYAAAVWRIGLMGPNARPDAVALILSALAETLGR